MYNCLNKFLSKNEAEGFLKKSFKGAQKELDNTSISILYNNKKNLVCLYMDPDGKYVPLSIFNILDIDFNWRDFCDIKKNKLLEQADSSYIFQEIISISLHYLFFMEEYYELEKCFEYWLSVYNKNIELFPYLDLNAFLFSNSNINLQASPAYQQELAVVNGRIVICNLLSLIKINKPKNLRNSLQAYILHAVLYPDEAIREDIFREKYFANGKKKIDYWVQKNPSVKNKYEEILNRNFKLSVQSISPILDNIENDKNSLKEFLHNFKESSDDNLWKVSNTRDWRVKDFEKILRENTERLTEIFKNYIYSEYSRTQKLKGLEKTLYQISEVYRVFDFEDATFFDVIMDLPDKVKAYALKIVTD